MGSDLAGKPNAIVDRVYRIESRRVLETLIRLLGDFDVAEEAMHEAFGAALEQWPRDGVPDNPRAWLVSAGRFKAIDAMRRNSRFDALEEMAERIEAIADDAADRDPDDVVDDRLRLIFTCSHPALAQRIVRAKAKIREARIPYQEPSPDELPDRLDSVLRVIYLVFNEGYSASSGASLTRPELSGEAICWSSCCPNPRPMACSP